MVDPTAKQACEKQNAINQKAYLNAQKFSKSLERNIQTLESYKDFPQQLNKLISIKETRMEQILCNIESISDLLGGWLSKNGKRFKAWVELFVLIKGILKSWQLLIDIFKDYDEECHQCKNERQDLQNYMFRLISAVIPRLPIIQFPKWPDIILDLHNVRAGIHLSLPDFNLNLRPIVIPNLPNLKLPDLPDVNFSLPDLPLLPEIRLPDLPDLPSLPTVDLPDLPPPPNIPKLFGAVEGILNIMKLVTKVMCILKKSPFVPEWRAGDQIAFITERNGYLPTDFLDITLPQFSYPFVDAIKVTTYVNLEFETEFLMEAVRQVTQPLSGFSSNIANMIDIRVPDFDFSENTPTEIDVNVKKDGNVDVNGTDISSFNMTTQGFMLLASIFGKEIERGYKYISQHANETTVSQDFVAFVQSQLASPSITSDPRLDDLRKLWDDIAHLTYSREDTLIQTLQKNKDDKFDALTNIISTELENTKQLKQQIQDIGNPSFIQPVIANSQSQIQSYQEALQPQNVAFVKAAQNLIHPQEDPTETDIETGGKKLLTQVQNDISKYSNGLLAAKTPDTSTDSSG